MKFIFLQLLGFLLEKTFKLFFFFNFFIFYYVLWGFFVCAITICEIFSTQLWLCSEPFIEVTDFDRLANCQGFIKADTHTHTQSLIEANGQGYQSRYTHTQSLIEASGQGYQSRYTHTQSLIEANGQGYQSRYTHTHTQKDNMRSTCVIEKFISLWESAVISQTCGATCFTCSRSSFKRVISRLI